jgi:hypothetical protein
MIEYTKTEVVLLADPQIQMVLFGKKPPKGFIAFSYTELFAIYQRSDKDFPNHIDLSIFLADIDISSKVEDQLQISTIPTLSNDNTSSLCKSIQCFTYISKSPPSEYLKLLSICYQPP